MAIDLSGNPLPKGIHQRKNGLYVGRFKFRKQSYVFYDRDLKRLQETLDDKRYEVRHRLVFKEDSITMDEWFESWMSNYKSGLKATTVYAYRQVYQLYAQPYLGNQRLRDIQTQDIQTLINHMFEEGKSRSRINILYVVVLGMYKKAVRLNMVQHNPAEAVEFPRNRPHTSMRVMTLEEQNLFLHYAYNYTFYDVYITALCTGMRIGEILALHWQDVDFSANVIHVRGTLVYVGNKDTRFIDTPKSYSSQREIPMLTQLNLLLRRRKTLQDAKRQDPDSDWKITPGFEDLVFTAPRGGICWDASVRMEIDRIVKAINKDGISFQRITPHTFRHTFATRGLENGIPPKVMQTILGHSSLSITMDRYSHVLPDTKAQEMQKINNIF